MNNIKLSVCGACEEGGCVGRRLSQFADFKCRSAIDERGDVGVGHNLFEDRQHIGGVVLNASYAVTATLAGDRLRGLEAQEMMPS